MSGLSAPDADWPARLCKAADPKSWILIGLGNQDRADDGFGIVLAEALIADFPDRVFSEDRRSAEGVVLDVCDNPFIRAVLFLDAADFGGRPGDVRLFSSENLSDFVPALSTHKVPISILFGLLSTRGKHPFLLGVQPGSLDFLGLMSDPVQKTVETLTGMIRDVLGSYPLP